MTYIIRDLKSYDDMVALRQLQYHIWGFAESGMGLYPPLSLTVSKNGGVVLGAFDEKNGQMIGFLFSFLGREAGGLFKVCSQVMGVDPQWRGRGIAEDLKHIQRERTLAQNLPLITWTYDPLEAPNAHLNLHKLRAISRTYWRDVYGSNFGTLNAGLPSDRLLVEWWVKGPRLDEEAEIDWDVLDEAPAIFETTGREPTRQIVRANFALEAETLQLEIPADVHPLKAANMELAYDWRMKARRAFETYFDKGYILTDFISFSERGERRNRYLLQKETPKLLTEIGIET